MQAVALPEEICWLLEGLSCEQCFVETEEEVYVDNLGDFLEHQKPGLLAIFPPPPVLTSLHRHLEPEGIFLLGSVLLVSSTLIEYVVKNRCVWVWYGLRQVWFTAAFKAPWRNPLNDIYNRYAEDFLAEGLRNENLSAGAQDQRDHILRGFQQIKSSLKKMIEETSFLGILFGFLILLKMS
ncbi:hypothetical protein STEG23_007938 [Scotinomys teguina]